jgi:hypothetical protein
MKNVRAGAFAGSRTINTGKLPVSQKQARIAAGRADKFGWLDCKGMRQENAGF